jgi:predicted DNA-binding protein
MRETKKSSTFRLSELTRAQIKYLSEKWGKSEAEVIAAAVEEVAAIQMINIGGDVPLSQLTKIRIKERRGI